MSNAIAFDYRATGEVQCKNPKGLVFFLRPAAPPPAPRSWTPVEATKEVEVKRHAGPQTMAEVQRTVPQAAVAEPLPTPAATFKAVEATKEVAVNRGTAPLTGAPEPGKPAQKGWFGKLFGK